MDDPIEFDPVKEALNRAKHGVSLARANDLHERDLRIVSDDRASYGERRLIAYGKLGDRLHILVFTRRPGVVRVISLRKANVREVKRYGQD